MYRDGKNDERLVFHSASSPAPSNLAIDTTPPYPITPPTAARGTNCRCRVIYRYNAPVSSALNYRDGGRLEDLLGQGGVLPA